MVRLAAVACYGSRGHVGAVVALMMLSASVHFAMVCLSVMELT